MPHLSVKMYPGRSEEVKQDFAEFRGEGTWLYPECGLGVIQGD